MRSTCAKRAKFLLFFMFFVSICKFDTIGCRLSRYVCLKLIIDELENFQHQPRQLRSNDCVFKAKFGLWPLFRCQSRELDSSFEIRFSEWDSVFERLINWHTAPLCQQQALSLRCESREETADSR